MIGNDPHIEIAFDADGGPAFAVEGGWIFRLVAAPDIEASVVAGVALDSSETEADPALGIGAVETAAIAPSPVQVVVIGPGKLEVVASRGVSLMGGPIEEEALRRWTIRIGLAEIADGQGPIGGVGRLPGLMGILKIA